MSSKRAVIYIRVSSEEQVKGTSPDVQRDACLLEARRMGAEVVEICEDMGISGVRYTSRLGIVKALKLIESGEANCLIATKVDRIGRSASIIIDVARRVRDKGAELVTSDAKFDNTPMGTFTLTLFAGMAEMERGNIRERTTGGRLRRAQEGLQPSRSRSPFGLHVVTGKEKASGLYPDHVAGTYLLVPSEAETVKAIFDRYERGESLRAICRWLNECAIPAPRGGLYWRSSTLHKMLVNPCYCGHGTFGKHLRTVEETGETTTVRTRLNDTWLSIDCPAIVSAETFEQCQRRLQGAQATFSGSPERKHTLTGLLRCPDCGRGMRGTRRERKTKAGTPILEAVYQCPDSRASRNPGGVVCNKKRHGAMSAERIIKRGLFDTAHDRRLIASALEAYQNEQKDGYDPAEHQRLETALRALEARERATVEAQVQGVMAGANPAFYAAGFREIATQRGQLNERLRALEAQQKPGDGRSIETEAGQFARALTDLEIALNAPGLSESDRHDLLATVVEGITPEGDEAYRIMLRPIDAQSAHSIIMVGPPGSGKTMLARRVPSVLPPLSLEEALDVTKIYSVGGLLGTHASLVTKRPFRSPHHSVSNAALAGGGSTPRPGEVSLSHHGILFLDELPEFRRDVLEVLRQPLEDGHVTIARVAGTMTYPAQIMLVAAMNPCPCGYFGDTVKTCSCSQSQIQKYLQRISGPLLDRIDIHIEVPRLRQEDMLHSGGTGEPSSAIRERVVAARERQSHRFSDSASLHCNAHMQSRQIKQYCPVGDDVKDLLRAAVSQLGLSARAYDRILKLSRTVADLEDQPTIQIAHVAEAIQYRALDRKLWG